jgi:tetratricopeptide (TPR) repeat protein
MNRLAISFGVMVATLTMLGEAPAQTNSPSPESLAIDAEHIDQTILQAEKATEGPKATPEALMRLGACYRIKGDLLAEKTADGNLILTAESQPWYQKSVPTLTRAVLLDHEFNEENRRKELSHGRKPDQIADVGNYDIYWNLGLTDMRLGNFPEALKAYQYMRHLAPTMPDSYLSVASAYTATGKNDEAAIALLQALFLDSHRQEALRLVVEIYRQTDRDGCAVIRLAGRPDPQLNADCPIVKSNICQACAGLYQNYTASRQVKLAQQTRETAISSYHCSPELFAPPAAKEAK